MARYLQHRAPPPRHWHAGAQHTLPPQPSAVSRGAAGDRVFPAHHVTTVQSNGIVKFKGQTLKVSNALRGLPIAFRPDDAQDGVYSLYFAHHRLMQVDLRETA